MVGSARQQPVRASGGLFHRQQFSLVRLVLAKRWLGAAAFPLALFLLNCYFAKDLFSLEYSQFMGSIEAAYISISRYMIANWRDLSWFPLWYGGIPFQNSYPPLLHGVVAVTATILRMSPAHAHHFVTAFFYALGPVALYALALRLTKSRWYSFWAGWIYSIFSPCLWLMPSIHLDAGWFGLRRFQVLVPYGEGPHITSLALLPLALLSLDVALSKRTPLWYVLAAASMAGVALSNWLGAFALAIAVFAYLLARSGAKETVRTLVATLGLGALAYALACSWIPPSTIGDIRYNAQYLGPYQHVYQSLPLYTVIGIVCALSLKYVMHRWRISEPLQFFVLFALLISVIPLGAEWFHVLIVPQPERYQLEMDLALCLAAVFLLRPFFDKLPGSYKVVVMVALLALSLFPARLDRRFARRMIKPIDFSSTIEYQTAKWFDANLNGGRVMAPGTISYWLNAFTDTPQVGGGFDQGIVNRTLSGVEYQIFSGDGAGDRAAEIAALWLNAYGVQAIAVGGPDSREVYKPFRRPEVFASAFPEAVRDGGDTIYWVPGRTGSLAHVLARTSLVRDRPVHGLDIGQVQKYVQALNDPSIPPASFRWTSRHSAEIQAALRPDQVISVQVTYHPGWHATVNGRVCPLSGDGLGQVVIAPTCVGACNLQLIYDGGWEMRVARIVSWSSCAGCLVWIALYRRRRRI
jgi:hypothetical protein